MTDPERHRPRPTAAPFRDAVESPEELREIYHHAPEMTKAKKIDRLDEGCVEMIEGSSLVMIGTAAPDGRCEVSPRGGPAGFVKALDERWIAIPDLSGNNLLDSMENLIGNPEIALMFIVPGRDETLRVTGRAWITTDEDVRQRFTDEFKLPKSAIVVQVRTAFVHCAKALRRAGAWDPATWNPGAVRSAAEMLTTHIGLDIEPELLHEGLEASYAETLAAERSDS